MFCFEIEKGRKKPFRALFGTIFPVENICGSFICKISESTIQRKMEPDAQVLVHPVQCKLGQGWALGCCHLWSHVSTKYIAFLFNISWFLVVVTPWSCLTIGPVWGHMEGTAGAASVWQLSVLLHIFLAIAAEREQTEQDRHAGRAKINTCASTRLWGPSPEEQRHWNSLTTVCGD